MRVQGQKANLPEATHRLRGKQGEVKVGIFFSHRAQCLSPLSISSTNVLHFCKWNMLYFLHSLLIHPFCIFDFPIGNMFHQLFHLNIISNPKELVNQTKLKISTFTHLSRYSQKEFQHSLNTWLYRQRKWGPEK